MSPERGLLAVVAAAEKRLVALLPHVNGVAAFEGECDGRENRIFGETGCETFGIVGIAGFIIARPGMPDLLTRQQFFVGQFPHSVLAPE
jgi:hypothetical protein